MFYKKCLNIQSDENGMALVASLLVMVALTVLGITAMNNTTIDTMISGNDFKSQQRYYAAEGSAELALASFPDIVTGGVDDTIISFDDLLSFDPGGSRPVGDITPLLNSYLAIADFNLLLRPTNTQSAGLNMSAIAYSVRVEDDNDNEDSNPLNDVNRKVKLITYETVADSDMDLISYTIERILINLAGAVGLIDNNTSIVMDGDARIRGNDIDGIEGAVTIDMNTDYSSYDSQVRPNGVKQNFDQFVDPKIEDIHKVRDLLTHNKTPHTPDPDSIDGAITIGTGNDSDVKIDDYNKPEIIYVQGNVTIEDTLENKILVVEDYNPQNTTNYYMGLTLQRRFQGLIILLPRHPTSEIEIKLENNSANNTRGRIKGALIASSQSDPDDPSPNSGVKLVLEGDTYIKYDPDTIYKTGMERQFVVHERNYLPYHTTSSNH